VSAVPSAGDLSLALVSSSERPRDRPYFLSPGGPPLFSLF
jgi:hypothetical protein